MQHIFDSDRNTSFFHASMKANRKKLVTRLKLVNGLEEWTSNKRKIHDKAVEYFSSQLAKEQTHLDCGIMSIIPKIVSANDNAILEAHLQWKILKMQFSLWMTKVPLGKMA